jgi:hypothetical protein
VSLQEGCRVSLSQVDFAYAFATPHRLTVARPDSSDKTLLDLEPGRLRMAWTYGDLRDLPLAAFVTPPTTWEVHLQPELDGHPFARSTWTRAEGSLPVLDNTYIDARGSVQLEVAGGASAAIIRVHVANTGDRPHRLGLRCQVPGNLAGYNPAWVDPEVASDCLLAGWRDRADRVTLLGLGAEQYLVESNSLYLVWHLLPGEERRGWVVRPYRAYAADLPDLRSRDWLTELEQAKAEWRALLERASAVSIPDPGVRDGFYACLADLFIMREPVADGYIAGTPGTEVYRAANAFEPGIVAVALDQLGLYEQAASGYQMCLEQQGPDGNWADPHGWGHLMWASAGFKSWTAMEHFRLTGDRDYLAGVYPRMRASSHWQEQQRQRTRVSAGSDRPLTYGLMPRGMGDCGLLDDGDYYGVFLPHNIWAVFADRLTVEAAEILGESADLPELRAIHQTALADLLVALERGAIAGDGYCWIPGVPGKTCGSRWGVLNALFPCGILPRNHELISGTIRQIEAHLSPGGLPINTGWMPDGMWVAITLDNLAEAHLVRGDGDAAAEYLYAVLNHGTPLYSWCEERGQEAGTEKTSGDRQHLWTPVAVVRAVRDCLVMEDGDGLRLARGTARSWLASGEPVGIAEAATHFGTVSYGVQADLDAALLEGQVSFPDESSLAWAVLHVRLPLGWRLADVNPDSRARVLPDGSGLRWERPCGSCAIRTRLVRD